MKDEDLVKTQVYMEALKTDDEDKEEDKEDSAFPQNDVNCS